MAKYTASLVIKDNSFLVTFSVFLIFFVTLWTQHPVVGSRLNVINRKINIIVLSSFTPNSNWYLVISGLLPALFYSGTTKIGQVNLYLKPLHIFYLITIRGLTCI